MKKSPRSSKQIVNNFLGSDSSIQGDTISDVTRRLRLDTHHGSMEKMHALLSKALRGNRLFEYSEGGQTFFETQRARRRRLGLPAWASKSMLINGNVPEAVQA